MSTTLSFPVFASQKNDDMIYVYHSDIALKSTNTKILRDQGYAGIKLIDSSGRVYMISKAYQVRYLGLFGISLLKKGRQILVDFEYEDNISAVSLNNFKKEITEKIDRKTKFWESAWDIKELKGRIANSASFEEIAGLIR